MCRDRRSGRRRGTRLRRFPSTHRLTAPEIAFNFRPGSSSATFGYLAHSSWWRVVLWLRRKHPRANWRQLRRRYHLWSGITDGDITLFNSEAAGTTRYRYRGARIASPWSRAYESDVA